MNFQGSSFDGINPGSRKSRPDQPNAPFAKQGYSLSDARRNSLHVVMRMATFVIGIGTTGSRIAHHVVRRVAEGVGGIDRPRLPKHFTYLLIDAAARKENWDPEYFHHLQGGINGAGTVAQNGEKLGRDPINFDSLYKRMVTSVERLEADPLIPVGYTAREAVRFFVCGGFGGTSGGMLQVMLWLIHAAAAHCQVKTPLAYPFLVGPEMATSDPHYATDELQRRVLTANAAGNLTRIAADLLYADAETILLPNGREITVRRCDQVWAPILVDRSNGRVNCRNTSELVALQADALFHYVATQSGEHLAGQYCDHDQLGGPQRGRFSAENQS